MGFLDALKSLVPKNDPLPWDAQSIRHPQFTLRLPEGWRFTSADWTRATAAGPAGEAAEFFYLRQPGSKAQDTPKLLDLMRQLVRHDAGLKSTPTQTTLPDGVLWTEASEVKGPQQQFVVYVLKPQDTHLMQICLRTSLPAASGGVAAGRLEALRGLMRSVEWT